MSHEPAKVERVARAICDAHGRRNYPRMMDGSRRQYVDENWQRWTSHAVAALEAAA